MYVKSEPYAWPYNGDLTPENTALLVIDMQIDFCRSGNHKMDGRRKQMMWDGKEVFACNMI